MTRKKPGRPSTFTQEISDKICAQITQGYSIRKICGADDMPAVVTFFEWLRLHKEFAKQYAHAKEEQADAFAEDILDISDNATNENIQVAKLQVDSRKWLASKFKAKKYGDSTQLKHADADGNKLSIGDVLASVKPTTGIPDGDEEG